MSVKRNSAMEGFAAGFDRKGNIESSQYCLLNLHKDCPPQIYARMTSRKLKDVNYDLVLSLFVH